MNLPNSRTQEVSETKLVITRQNFFEDLESIRERFQIPKPAAPKEKKQHHQVYPVPLSYQTAASA